MFQLSRSEHRLSTVVTPYLIVCTQGRDEGAVNQDDFPALPGDLLQGSVQARRLGGEQFDEFVAPAADGGLGHVIAACHVGQALVMPQYAQNDHRDSPQPQDPPPGPDRLQVAA